MGIKRRNRQSRPFESPALEFPVCKTYDTHNAIALYHPDRFRQRHVCRKKNDSQVRCDESHRIFLAAREVSQEFSVARETVATEKQCALIDGGRGNRINASSGTQLHSGFDVSGGRLSSRARFYARFDKAADVIKMKDDRFCKVLRDRFSDAHNVVTALQVERACSMSQQLCVANDY